MDLSCRLRGPDIGVQSQLATRHGWLVTRHAYSHRRLSPRAQRTRCSWEDCLGLRGCPTPLLRPGHPGHRCTSPAERRVSFVCRLPPPMHLILHSHTFVDFEPRRGCCLLLFECPTDLGLRCCAAAILTTSPHARHLASISAHSCQLFGVPPYAVL